MVENTYKLADFPVTPMPWEVYKDHVSGELRALLDGGECAERAYQDLIERNPSLLPWMYGTFGGGHHGLIHGAIITQPRLPGLAGKQPDCLMIARDTGSVYAVLVEIESPCKTWFTKHGPPTAQLTQALNQLREWKAWFRAPGNSEKFIDEYRVPREYSAFRSFEQRYIVVFGRRSELQQSGRAAMRSRHEQSDERLITYDHLSPSEELRDAITARIDGSGYHALIVPPTVRMGPFEAHDHCVIDGKEAAAASHPLMAGDRAEFLRSRWPYWDAWANSSSSHSARSSDRE